VSIHTDLIDTTRIETAHAAYAALLKDEAEANAAVEQATVDAKAAADKAQRAADKGADVASLMALEEFVDTANRRLTVAKRVAAGASLRRQEGVQTRSEEIKQSHGAAANSAMTRFIAIRQDAKDLIARLEELKKEHVAVKADLSHMNAQANTGLPGVIVMHNGLTDEQGNVMNDAEWANRLNQNAWHEWDVVAGKLRWVEA
jgi:hypothetical protein